MRRDLHGNARGFTLMELLAAISVASIALVVLASAVRSQGSSAVYQMGAADMQQNVRGALDLFRREVRMAGFGMSAVPTTVLPALEVPALSSGELYRVNLFGNYGSVRSRVGTAGVAGGASTILLEPSGPSGACLPSSKSFMVGERVSIESALRGVAEVYEIAAYSQINCSITVSPMVVADGYEFGSPVNEVQQLGYMLDSNNVLWREGVVVADQIDAMQLAYILKDGTSVADPSSSLDDLRSASIAMRSEMQEHLGMTPNAALQTEVRIRNLDIVREPMIDNL
ncbi:MAG: prepilin-type N-terminal cleavage/methylation domain-containing protein [Deltaproteobacteria bacterium]|nr:prepilin-type N-terminal cleavage/methylation domain-containing protein [Deltaproteobacteria bacterium]